MGAAVEAYLGLMDAQRRTIFARLAGLDEARLWHHPGPKEWSIGENMDHARVLTQSFRRLLRVSWPVLAPVGWLRRYRPYETEIDDVYERPGFPLNVGWLWPPRYKSERPVPLSTLEQHLEAEHRRVRNFFAGKDEPVLGNIKLYDPAIGWLNFVQMLRVVVYHDAHHFRTIERLLGAETG